MMIRATNTSYSALSLAALGLSALLLTACTEKHAPSVAPEPLGAGSVVNTSGHETGTSTDWALLGNDPDGTHFSTLNQINTNNVEALGLAWSLDIDSPMGIQAEAIVIDGIAYFSSGTLNRVYAVNAADGRLLWQFEPELSLGTFEAGYAARINRGIAVLDSKVYLGTADCRLLALDATDGTKIWESPACGSEKNAYIAGAPRLGAGLVFIGYGGSENGAWGSVAAFDADTGKEVWRFYTLPGAPAEGANLEVLESIAASTWTGGEAPFAGATVWDGIIYDEETGFLVFGTSAPNQMNVLLRDPEERDNLFGNSVIAVDAKTGSYQWHYQTNPADAWNFDATMPKILADLELGGETRRVVIEVPKNGFFYLLDAESGELISARPIVEVSWASHIDLASGRPVEIPGQRYYKTENPEIPTRVTPTDTHLWHPMSYNPETGLVYIPVSDQSSTYTPGGQFGAHISGTREEGFEGIGRLIAWDPVAGEEAWSAEHSLPFNGGILSTAGNLVIQGTAEGVLNIYNAESGKHVWSFKTGASIQAAPVTYELDGEQYIVVGVGAGSGVSMAFWPEAAGDEARGRSRLLAFKLNGDATYELGETGVDPVPKPVNSRPAADQVANGKDLWDTYGCETCHGLEVVGRGARLLDGAIPDLRYITREVSDEWAGIVVGGSRHQKGMIGFAQYGMTVEEAELIKAYVTEASWQAYLSQTTD